MKKKNKPINSYVSKHSSKREKNLFYSLCDKNHDVIKTENFKQTLLKSGLKKNDNRLYSLFQMLDTFGKEIYYDDFIKSEIGKRLIVCENKLTKLKTNRR